MLTHGSLFTGIGGFDLGMEWAGIKTIWQVEIDEYCRRLLELRFPDARRYTDIRAFPDRNSYSNDAGKRRKIHQANAEPSGNSCDSIRAFAVADGESQRPARRDGIKGNDESADGCGKPDAGGVDRVGRKESSHVDIISGGFPCQPVSHAGKRQGAADDRYLWPEMFRVVQALRPRWVVAENVYGLITHEGGELLDKVYDDLEGEGYETLPPIVLPACAFGAPHRRDRVWIVAHAGHDNWSAEPEQQQGERAEGIDRSCGARPGAECSDWWSTEPAVGRVAHGIPRRVDRLRGLGNAIVPQIAYLIGKLILEAEEAGNRE